MIKGVNLATCFAYAMFFMLCLGTVMPVFISRDAAFAAALLTIIIALVAVTVEDKTND